MFQAYQPLELKNHTNESRQENTKVKANVPSKGAPKVVQICPMLPMLRRTEVQVLLKEETKRLMSNKTYNYPNEKRLIT